MKYLVLCYLLIAPLLGWAAEKLVTSAQADLDGDGAKEQISITVPKKEAHFTLRIGDQELTEKTDVDIDEFRCDGFRVVDIDTHDTYKELLVTTTDIAGDTQWLYWYDGKSIQRVGEYAFDLTLPGTGIVYHKWWKPFWQATDKYVLDAKTHALVLVLQPFYYVGVEAKVLKSIAIYADESKKKVVANLLPKSKIIILLNSGDWYLLKTSTGLTGWVQEDAIMPENFDGIVWAG